MRALIQNVHFKLVYKNVLEMGVGGGSADPFLFVISGVLRPGLDRLFFLC